MNHDPDQTRVSLLMRIRNRPDDGAVWEEFLMQYGPKINTWCRYWQIDTADAEDVGQQVMLKLVKQLPQFEYNPDQSFRGWLKVLVHNTWIDLVRTHKPGQKGSGDTAIGRLLDSIEARDDLVVRLQNEFDREIYESALDLARLRVEPQTWKAFELTAIEGRSGKEAADEIPMQVAQVYVAKRRVQQIVREEIEKMNH